MRRLRSTGPSQANCAQQGDSTIWKNTSHIGTTPLAPPGAEQAAAARAGGLYRRCWRARGGAASSRRTHRIADLCRLHERRAEGGAPSNVCGKRRTFQFRCPLGARPLHAPRPAHQGLSQRAWMHPILIRTQAASRPAAHMCTFFGSALAAAIATRDTRLLHPPERSHSSRTLQPRRRVPGRTSSASRAEPRPLDPLRARFAPRGSSSSRDRMCRGLTVRSERAPARGRGPVHGTRQAQNAPASPP